MHHAGLGGSILHSFALLVDLSTYQVKVPTEQVFVKGVQILRDRGIAKERHAQPGQVLYTVMLNGQESIHVGLLNDNPHIVHVVTMKNQILLLGMEARDVEWTHQSDDE
jgi:hypothetical protein